MCAYSIIRWRRLVPAAAARGRAEARLRAMRAAASRAGEEASGEGSPHICLGIWLWFHGYNFTNYIFSGLCAAAGPSAVQRGGRRAHPR